MRPISWIGLKNKWKLCRLLPMLRLATVQDAQAVAGIYDPIVSDTAISFETDPPGAAEMERRIARVLTLAPWLVDSAGGEIRGYAYASRHHERCAYQCSVDVACYVSAAHRRHGVGTALYSALFPLLRRQGFFAAHAGITLPNAASVRLHESLGFRPVGVYRA